ncbi:OmpA family protein [Chondrinema litorale]|uniref:OmpA family protein n=1 Tax=Chondrinema litorale TaxID=2994555 RepID=UPI002543F6C9|nr:OmpA family protein [Chondrinema litorale]UZR94000.1 OmpA family protein [Chondrinema litorale]
MVFTNQKTKHKQLIYSLLFGCLLVCSNLTYAQNVKSLLKKGEKEYNDDNIKGSLEYFEKALSIDNNNYTAAYFAGVGYLRLASPQKALERLSIIRPERFKDSKDIYYWLAFAQFRNNHFDEALSNIEIHKDKYRTLMSDEVDELEKSIHAAKKIYANAKPVRVENLGGNINSENPEYSAILTKDHRTIHYTTRREDNKGGEKTGTYMEDILTSSLDENDEWGKAERLKGLVTVGHDATVQLFGDDKKMMIYQKKDLFVTEFEHGKWTHPKSLGSNINNRNSRESHGFISPDEQTLVFSSDYKNKDGDLDLFISHKSSNGEWGKASPLNELNTEEDEDSPFIAEDGTLYFSSKGHNSMGGFDIFKSEYNPTSRRYKKPENMGYPLNSVSDDIFFNVKNDVAYFTSNRIGGMGREDIYRAYLFDTVDVNLTVLNIADDSPVNEAIIVLQSGIESLDLTTDQQGKAHCVVPAFTDVSVRVFKDDKEVYTEKFSPLGSLKDPENLEKTIRINLAGAQELDAVAKNDVQVEESIMPITEEVEEVKEEIVEEQPIVDEEEVVQPVDESTGVVAKADFSNKEMQEAKELESKFNSASGKFVLKRIYFDMDEAKLKSESFDELNGIVAYLVQNPKINAEIGGHTDNVGPRDYNKYLSQRRAQAVVDYLIENGVESSRLTAVGYGEVNPIVSNDDEKDGREINRRIELKVIKKEDGFSRAN